MTKKFWSKIISIMMLGAMIFGVIAPSTAVAVSTPQETAVTDLVESNRAVVKGPFAPADNSDLPPETPPEPQKDDNQREQPGTFPLPKSENLEPAPKNWVDPALRSFDVLAPMPATIQNWEGISSTGVQPPDTDGQVGPNHYVQVVNSGTTGTQVRVWNKTGTQLYDFGMDSLWPSGDACRENAYGDPVVLYDQMADRWVLTQFIYPRFNNEWYECIAVSVGAEPTDVPSNWFVYSFVTDAVNFPDYPKFGVWPDGYYMMAHQFANATTWAGTGVFVFDRDAMLVGDPATFQYVDLYPVNPNYGGMLPANLMGSTLPPANSPNYFVEVDMDWNGTSDILTIFEAQTTWPSGFTFDVVDELVTAPFVAPVCGNTRGQCIDQPNTTTQLEAIADRLMMHAWYRNMGSYEVIVTNHTVNVGSNIAGIRWYEIRKDSGGSHWYIYQQGTYSPDSDHRWMGSIAMDRVGNIALGYSVSSATTYPTIRYAGRLASDPLNTLPQTEATIIDGQGYHTGTRWGDYSAMSVDPVDDCTFWYTQEYVASVGSGSWNTRIASFKFPNCNIGPTGTIKGTVSDSATAGPVAGASIVGNNLGGTISFGTTTNVNGEYLTSAPAETYTVTASAFGYHPAEIGGISVTVGVTTTQNFQLDAAEMYTVEGVVADATTGWPLYASIDIDGYPGDLIWTDPVDGAYSILLPEGITYTFQVETFVPGYTPINREIGPLTSNRVEDFDLFADLATCEAPGYVGGTVLAEQFESWPLPVGWSIVDNIGGGCIWQAGTSDDDPNNTGGAGDFADADSDFCGSSVAMDTELWTPVFDLSAYANTALEFKSDMRFFTGDVWDVDMSLNGGVNWTTNLLHRSGAAYGGPETITLPLTGAAGESEVRLRFHYQGDFDYWWQVDEVMIADPTVSCAPLPGGLVVGNIYDDNLLSPLSGAMVENESGLTATALDTPADPNVDDGFYTLFSPDGSQVFTATMVGNYGAAVETVNVLANDTIKQDFNIPSGWLGNDPESLSVTLQLGYSTTLPLSLTNAGGLPVGFEIVEAESGYTGLNLSQKPLKQEGKNKDYLVSPYTLRLESPLAMGDYLFDLDAGNLTGDSQLLGVEFADGYYWVTGANSGSDPNKLYKLDTAGNLVASYDQSPSTAGWGWVDLAYDGTYLYAADFTAIRQIDPATGATTGVSFPCPAAGCLGLAFDPASGHFWTAYFSSDLYELDNTGTVINNFSNSLAIMGLAWDLWSPGGPYLWGWSQDGTPGLLASQIDPATGIPTGVAFQGAEIGGSDISGGATIINGDHPDHSNRAIFLGLQQADSDTLVGYDLGAVTGVEIPWLSEDPITGTISMGSNQLVDVNFDASVVTETGVYTAELRILNDAPYGLLSIPVTMTVLASQEVSLMSGWNLITLEIEPAPAFTAQSLLEAINAQGGNCAEVDRWNGGLWDPHLVAYPGINNFPIEMGQGYFLRCSQSSSWSYPGSALSAGISLSLAAGWNLVGVPYPGGYQAQSLLEAINAQGGDCTEADRWNGGLWDPHLVGYPGINNFPIVADLGYFLRCTQTSTFTPTAP